MAKTITCDSANCKTVIADADKNKNLEMLSQGIAILSKALETRMQVARKGKLDFCSVQCLVDFVMSNDLKK